MKATSASPAMARHERLAVVPTQPAGTDLAEPLRIAQVVDDLVERITPKDEVKLSSLPGGTVATTWHHGAPEEADRACEALEAWMQQRGVEPLGALWAVHHIDPTPLPERGSPKTELIWPFRE